MSMAKFAILSVVLGTPFGLAVYTDLTADPPPPLRSYADDFGPELDDDELDYDPAELDEEPSLEESLVQSLGYAPTDMSKDDFDDFASIIRERSERLLADGSRAGTTLTFADGVDLRHQLSDAWGDAETHTDAQGTTRHVWFNEDDGVRAMFETGPGPRRLTLSTYTALTMLVDEAMTSVGEPIENLLVPDTMTNPIELTRPPTEYSDGPTRMLVSHAKGKVTGYRIEIDLRFGPDAGMHQISSLRSHGEMVPMDLDEGTVYSFAAEVGAARLSVRPHADSGGLVIRVDAPGQPSR
ncbi:MAG TPA: hypothetical protein VML75_24195 [Kofleriaceae bacterium]|nr:hypothetical protein [Kofleriaceae bacterium]